MKYIVFLDFDGVLTSSRVHYAHNATYPMWARFDPVAVDFLNRIHDTFVDVSFVWSTTWRNGIVETAHTEHWAWSMFANAGFRGQFGKPWRVNQNNDQSKYHVRAEEVKEYLNDYGSGTKDFLVLDDSDYNWDKALPVKRWVKTDSENGLLWKHMRDAMSMMGTWEKKKNA